jgi:hypothetical protein
MRQFGILLLSVPLAAACHQAGSTSKVAPVGARGAAQTPESLAVDNAPPSGLERGSRVRVLVPALSGSGAFRVVGRLDHLQNDTVYLARSGREPLAMSLTGGQRLEVARGSRGHAAIGAAVGMAASGVLLAILASSDNRDRGCPSSSQPCWNINIEPPAGAVGAGLVLLLAAGGGVGALIGSSIHTNVWETVNTTGVTVASGTRDRPRFQVIAAPNALGARLAF